jgi:oligopeptide/dipeptide ABC transporter ATP-binding protein
MYAGSLVELGPVPQVLESPRHPYTRALARAIPRRYKGAGSLDVIPGSVPNPMRIPLGCPIAEPVCGNPPVPPLLLAEASGDTGPHRAACHFSERVRWRA